MTTDRAPTLPVVGIPLAEGQPRWPLPARQEITAWFQNPENFVQVSLFMRAMADFQRMDIRERDSYFQVAGIHSKPLVPWDGVKWENTKGEPEMKQYGAEERVRTDDEPGFCNHNMVTFATWHRPYLLLFEQCLWDNMQRLIKFWTEQGRFEDHAELQQWTAAASSFRLPYWDWATQQTYGHADANKQFCIPEVFTIDTITIAAPGNEVETNFKNPLVRFTNPSGLPMGDKSMGDNAITATIENKGKPNEKVMPWNECIGTSRYGIIVDKDHRDPGVWKNGINNWQSLNEAMNDPMRSPTWQLSNLTEMVGRLMAPNTFESWEVFSSTLVINQKRIPGNTQYLSLEGIHNIIHNTTGGVYINQKEADDTQRIGFKGVGLGHMCDVPVAAFDPVFWFHHCNIDRLAAIWQALNNDLWFNKPVPRYDPEPKDFLAPFHTDDKEGEWTSTKCRYVNDMNYTYNDLISDKYDPVKEKGAYLAELREKVDKLYPHTSKRTNEFRAFIPGFVSKHNEFDDYVINVIYDRNALGGHPYSILFYLADPEDTNAEPIYAGKVYTFSTATTSCSNCASQAADEAILSRAQIPLTVPILNGISASAIRRQTIEGASSSLSFGAYLNDFGTLDSNVIEQVLEKELQWIFVETGGTVRDKADFPRTEITLLKGKGVPTAIGDEHTTGYKDYAPLRWATKESEFGWSALGSTRGTIVPGSD